MWYVYVCDVHIFPHTILLFTTTEKKQVLKPTQLFGLTSYPFKSKSLKTETINKCFVEANNA